MSRASRSQLARVLADRFATAKDVPALEHAIAEYLLREKRVGELDSLLRDIAQIRADEGYVEADVVSAFPLTDAAEADAKDLLKSAYPDAKSIVLNERINSDVIGGMRLELANQQLDLSIRAKLNQFKQLTGATSERMAK